MKLLPFVSACALASLVAACGTTGPGSANGECRLFLAPTEPVTGADLSSQIWISETLETGATLCGWKRVVR